MKIDVKKVVKLTNLPLTPSEEKKYSKQLSKILDYIEQLNKVDTSDVQPTFNVSGQENVMGEDEIGDCTVSQEEALSNANQKRGGFFVTKGVFVEDL